ncbi:XS domain containing protein-like [Oryza sativa Japonica Group]|uniref:XS domain containing protein-like n=2 Tax=Oryza sativa subsp. japonica TaxID=39947 RepID=Q5VNZ5_ORYSJ|nr:XS domain containing protein-like [Oryza sativa Japonica Group]BAD69076.1 XS domain containing protein-like [Oryza sativa Japonica Group]
MTELGAPHRETAQASLCRFGRGPWVRMKPGIYLTGTNVPSPGANTPAPARDECLEALVLTGWGEACVRPLVAT